MTTTRGARAGRDFAAELTLLQLRSVPLFGGCDDAQLGDIAAASGERRFAVGDTVARAGTVVRDVPIVLDGYAGAEIDAQPAVVLGPGAVIGGPTTVIVRSGQRPLENALAQRHQGAGVRNMALEPILRTACRR